MALVVLVVVEAVVVEEDEADSKPRPSVTTNS
jgi:hypothetical protein